MGITGANFAIAETGHDFDHRKRRQRALVFFATANSRRGGRHRETVAARRGTRAVPAAARDRRRRAGADLLQPPHRRPAPGEGRTARRNSTSCSSTTAAPSLLADAEQRDALHCIRCGACLNVCPIFKNVGGHTYGTTYPGPIGSVITPHLRGLQDWKHLSYASSLCGACTDVCPVKIDLHHHLLQNRRNAVRQKFDDPLQRMAFRVWLWTMQSSTRYRFAGKLFGLAHPLLRAWTATRDLPATPARGVLGIGGGNMDLARGKDP